MLKKFLKTLLEQKIRIISVFLLLIYFFSSTIFPVLANISYTYDANGNMTSDGINCYAYNDENQMVKTINCATGKLIDQSIYDDQGNRVKQQIYDQNGLLLKTIYTPTSDYELTVLASNSAKVQTSYYHANGEVVAKKNNDGSLAYYLHDNLNSTTALQDQNQNTLEKTSYTPFGTVTSGGKQTKQLYTDQINDTQANSQSQLDYYNARYYNPHIMHFTQPDTQINNIYDPQQLNRYAYANNNPTTFNDPTGHCPVCIAIGVAGVIGGLSAYFVDMVIHPKATLQDHLKVGLIGSGVGMLTGVFGAGAEAVATVTLARLGVSSVAKNVISGLAGDTMSSITSTFISNKMQNRPLNDNLGRDVFIDSTVGLVTGNAADKLVPAVVGRPANFFKLDRNPVKFGPSIGRQLENRTVQQVFDSFTHSSLDIINDNLNRGKNNSNMYNN